MSIQDNISL